MQLTQGLQKDKNNYAKEVILSPQSRQELHWWVLNTTSFNGSPIVTPSPDVTSHTDASQGGWEGVCSNQQANGKWSATEKCLILKINVLRVPLQHFKADKGQTFNYCFPQHKQHNSGGLHQSPGWDTFSSTTPTRTTVRELVREEQHIPSRSPRPRQIEEPCGPRASKIC